MNILNMYLLHCILCASERKYFRIYDALQIKIIIIIIIICRLWFSCSRFSCRSFAPCAETPTGSASFSRSSCVDVSLLSYGAASQSSRFVTPNPIGRRTDKFASAASPSDQTRRRWLSTTGSCLFNYVDVEWFLLLLQCSCYLAVMINLKMAFPGVLY